jgi:hypothetical protein
MLGHLRCPIAHARCHRSDYRGRRSHRRWWSAVQGCSPLQATSIGTDSMIGAGKCRGRHRWSAPGRCTPDRTSCAFSCRPSSSVPRPGSPPDGRQDQPCRGRQWPARRHGAIGHRANGKEERSDQRPPGYPPRRSARHPTQGRCWSQRPILEPDAPSRIGENRLFDHLFCGLALPVRRARHGRRGLHREARASEGSVRLCRVRWPRPRQPGGP